MPVEKGRCFSSFSHKFPTLGKYSKLFTFAKTMDPTAMLLLDTAEFCFYFLTSKRAQKVRHACKS
jgi:hypothetical protein